MNIFIITGIFPPDIGGPASYVPFIAKAFTERGHQVSVLTLSESHVPHNGYYPFRVIRIRRSLPKLWRFARTVVHIIQHGKNADVLFVHGLALEASVANVYLRKPLVHKVVGDLVWERCRTLGLTDDGIELFQNKQYRLRIEFLKRLRSFWITKSHAIIAPSMYLKNIIHGWGAAETKIKVIYNAVQLERVAHSEMPDVFQRIGADSPKIVSVGRLVSWKGFEELITILPRMQKAHLIIIGEGPERPGLEALIHKHNVQQRVHLTGRLSRDSVFACLQHADVFVLNSQYEGLPHIVLEAFTARAPVIATDAGGTGELVQNGYNGLLIAPSNPVLLERSIQRLLEDQQFKQQLIHNGFETLKTFDGQRLVCQTEDVLLQTAFAGKHTHAALAGARDNHKLPVLFISTTRVGNPPDSTLVKKWKGLEDFFQSTVIAFGGSTTCVRSALAGARLLLLPSSYPRFIRYGFHFLITFLWSFCGALRKKYCAIIAQSPYEAFAPALALLPWSIIGAASRPKLIVELHSDWKEGVMLYHRSRFSWIEKQARTLIGRISFAQADSFRSISDYCTRLIPDKRKPVFVFPTFTDLENFQDPPRERIQEVATRQGTGFFLYAGMLIYLKGIHHLIRAFQAVHKKHTGARLVIAGKGEEEKKLKQLVESLGMNEEVFFVGHLDQHMLSAYIKNATALVLPSLTEGLGRVAIEAHLLERPVIASRVGGIPEIVIDGTTGFLCDPGDEQSLYNAMVKLLDNPGLAERLGKAGKEAVADKFDYTTYYRSYYSMVKKTCGL